MFGRSCVSDARPHPYEISKCWSLWNALHCRKVCRLTTQKCAAIKRSNDVSQMVPGKHFMKRRFQNLQLGIFRVKHEETVAFSAANQSIAFLPGQINQSKCGCTEI